MFQSESLGNFKKITTANKSIKNGSRLITGITPQTILKHLLCSTSMEHLANLPI